MTFIWKLNSITGYWVKQKECLVENAEQWLRIFKADDPLATYKVSKKKPSY